MKLNKMLLVIILILTILSLGTVCAQDNITSDMGDEKNLDNLNTLSEVNKDINNKDMQTGGTDDDNLCLSNEDIVGEIASNNVTVEVSNVFNGCETTISVTAPKAMGTVNITVGEKIYSPEFADGVARQTISEYDFGVNKVIVRYNDVVKETSFKALDGIVTNETFTDYYEFISGIYNNGEPYQRYKMFSYIPKGAILDFRGLINITNVEYAYGGKSLTIMSSTKDAIIDGNIRFEGDGTVVISPFNKGDEVYSNYISNLNVTGYLSITKASLFNSNVGELSVYDKCNINNVSVRGQTIFHAGTAYNISIFNSSLLGGLTAFDFGIINNFTVKNCIVVGDFLNNNTSIKNGASIENNVIYGNVYLRGSSFIVRNNTINAPGSNYALYFTGSNNCIVDNTIYNYEYDYAIYFNNNCTVVNNTLFSNKFGDNAVKIGNNYPSNIIIENNTPNQIPVIVANTKKIIYDECVSISVNVNATGNVTIDINGKKYDLELINGSANLIIDEYHSGTNNIKVYYSDVPNAIYGFNKTTFYVEKIGFCPIELNYKNSTECKPSTIEVILPNDANGSIIFKLSNDAYYITIKQDAKGSNNIITVPSLIDGNYIINVTFISDKYVTNSSSGYLSFVYVPIYKLTVSNVVMDYNDGSKYKVLVTKDGKSVGARVSVKITFNGVTKTVKTDKKGYATLTLDAAPKTYTIKATCNGVTKSSKVTIKNILKAKNVSKKKAKKIKFSVTLKNSKGKAVIGKITFKIKSKTYTKKTNKKGVATLTLKDLKVGKYIITSKYGACTVKNTIKIKK